RQAALCDQDGAVIGATPGYGAAAPAPATLSRLIEESATEADRLVKRLVETGKRTIGIGIARLADNPARHLVILVDDNSGTVVPETAAGEQPRPAPRAGRPSSAPEPSEPPMDGWYFDRVTTPVDPGESVPADRIRPVADLASTPVRFTWRTDDAGCFTMVSPEFAAAVGIGAADIGGRTFADVARTFNLDPDGEIAGLLSRRDTWSGRSLLWPIAGTDLKAPVDLAALPTYSRDRVFEGFRGFGIVRLADAVVDPEAIGLALISPASPAAADEAEPRPHGASRDPFLGETPALAISPTPERRFPDKIIRLAERRPHTVAPGDRALSAVEREAFREIGERLRQDEEPGVAGEEIPSAPAPDIDQGHWPVDEGAEPGSVGEGLQAWDEAIPAPVASEPAADTPDMDGFWPEELAADLDVAETGDDLHDWDGEIPKPVLEPEMPVLPAKGSAAGLLSRLPLPMLVHSGDRLHFVNDEFLAATGYDSLDDLVRAGGIGALIAGPYPAGDSEPPRRRPVRLVDKAGDEHPVEAHLQTIPWEEGRALLLSLRPAPITIVSDGAQNASAQVDL
ncbi:MAG: PAS domain-containing sensor histidine kinase, partial [Rhizobiaceae bacterium]